MKGYPSELENQTIAEIQTGLKKLDRHDWQLWWHTVVVMLMLTAAVVSLSLSVLFKDEEPFFQYNLGLSVRGLIGLVLLFITYALYQQVLIKRLRRQLAEKQVHVEVFEKLAMFDPLTGLYNRRLAEQRLATEISRSERKGHPLTVLMVDLNDFKQINDQYGHSAGDLVLKEFAECLNRAIRGSDLAVRMGGDEFLVILPECSPPQVQNVLDRLGSPETDLGSTKIRISFSAGWKRYEAGERPEDLLEGADRALYINKRSSGSNPVSLNSAPALLQ